MFRKVAMFMGPMRYMGCCQDRWNEIGKLFKMKRSGLEKNGAGEKLVGF